MLKFSMMNNKTVIVSPWLKELKELKEEEMSFRLELGGIIKEPPEMSTQIGRKIHTHTLSPTTL